MNGMCYGGNAYTSVGVTLDICENARTRTDLFDWATLGYRLVTNTWQDVQAVARRHAFPALENDKLGESVHKCWRREYDSAGEVLKDVQEFLQSQSILTDGDDIAGFDRNQLG